VAYRRCMTGFLVEAYAPGLGDDGLARAVERLRAAEPVMAAAGHPVRHVRSYVVPGDEMCFHLLEASSPEDVLEAARLAGIEAERVVEAIGMGSGS
jgi:hypothetical protein